MHDCEHKVQSHECNSNIINLCFPHFLSSPLPIPPPPPAGVEMLCKVIYSTGCVSTKTKACQLHWHEYTSMLPKGQRISHYTWQSPDRKVYYPQLLTTSYQILDINVLAHVYWVPTTSIMWCNTHSAENSSRLRQLVARILIIPTLHYIIVTGMSDKCRHCNKHVNK